MPADLFFTREPLLNRHGKVVATRLQVTLGALPQTALCEALDALRPHWPGGDKTVFLTLRDADPTPALLAWEAPANVALEVRLAALAALPAGELPHVALCLHLAAEDAAPPTATRYLAIAADTDAAALRRQLARLPAAGMPVAFGASTPAHFAACNEAGINAVAGWFCKQPPARPAKTIQPGHAHILRVINLVRNNADVSQIEAALKEDVALSYKLLRYINSAGFGLSCEIQSFSHAVAILGYDKLNRWLSLLLATASKDPLAPALLHTALARARLMELLGHGLVSAEEYDNLFITGAFSLLDIMLGVGMEHVLEAMHLPAAISDALLGKGGAYAPFLALAAACEGEHSAPLAEQAAALGLTADTVNRAQLEALSFADRLEF